MDTLYTARLHGFPNLSRNSLDPTILSEENVLSLLIVLGSSISLVGLVFAFITYSLFSDLRNLSGTTLMNLLAALFMTQLLYVVGVGGVPDPDMCIALAFSLQYVRLCVFCWMLTMAHHLHSQFRASLHLIPINDKKIGKHFIRYSLFGWILPGALLGASVWVQYHDKGSKLLDISTLKSQKCWFLDRNAFVYGLLMPSAILIFITLFYLIHSAFLERYIINMQVDKRIRDKMRRKRMMQILLFAKITFILALVTVLGAFAKFWDTETAWIIYHLGQGLQGIFVAMLVTCNCQVLKLYAKNVKSRITHHIPIYGNMNKGKAPMSRSTSLQLLTWEPLPDLV